MNALGEAASKLRGELGESLATVQKFDVQLEQATTPSLEALKAYSLGNRAFDETGSAASLPHRLRAIELGPNFALGYLAVASDFYILGEVGRASEYYTKAFQLREHASEREKLMIADDYYSNVTGELDKAVQTYQEEVESYPREPRAYSSLSYVFGDQGQGRGRIWEWLAPTPCSREPRRERMPPASGRSPPTKISLPSGKTPTPTSPS